MIRRSVVLGLALASVVATGGCAVWGPEGGPGGAGIDAGSSSAPAPVDAIPGQDGVQRVEITVGDDLRLHPSSVRARPGVVEFVFHNVGTTPHDVRVEPGGQGTGNLNGGASVTVRVSVAGPGHYPFPCLYHVSSGMTGTLEVV